MGLRGRGGRGSEGASEGGRWLAAPSNAVEAGLRAALDQAAAREADEVALRRVWARVADLPDQNPLTMAADAVREAAGGPRAMRSELGRRSRGPWIVAASLAGATIALAFMLVQTRSQGPRGPQGVPGQAAIARAVPAASPDAKGNDAMLGSSVVAPATVRTGAGEKLRLTLRGGTDVVVLSESVLVLDDKDRPSVSAGEVQFHVPKQKLGRTFEVSARDYRVVVIGTRFSVRVDRERTAVGVSEGVVEIWTDHRIARVAAGESWSAVERPEAVTAPSPVPSRTVAKVVGPRTSRAPRTAAGSLSASNLSGSNLSGSNKEAPARTMLAMAAPAQPTAANATGSSVSAAAPSSAGAAVGATTVAASAAAPAGVGAGFSPAPDESPAATPPTAAAEAPLTAQARAARAAGDSRRALGLYRTLAQRGGAAGENAEYEIGRILRDNLHQPREALAAWRTYRTAHPRGLLRVESDLSVIETLISLDDDAAALQEATEFLRRYPESERRGEVARLAGDLLRESGDCAGAIDAYDTALSGRVRRGMADSVSFHRAVCVQRGDRKAGGAALKTYLQAFPSGRFRTDAQKLLSQVP